MAEIHGTESFKEVTSHVDGSEVKSSFTVETYDIYCIFIYVSSFAYAHRMYDMCGILTYINVYDLFSSTSMYYTYVKSILLKFIVVHIRRAVDFNPLVCLV